MTDHNNSQTEFLPDSLEAVYQLVEARAAGQATDESLEAAVARLVPASSSHPPKEENGREADIAENDGEDEVEEEEEDDDDDDDDEDGDEDQLTIKEDIGNYDDEDEAEEEDMKNPRRSNIDSTTSSSQKRQHQKHKEEDSGDEEEDEEHPVRHKRGRPSREDAAKYNRKHPKVDWTTYEEIPFGKQGAQMLATFGDARQPLPETVRAALEATKTLVQSAMKDARALRDDFLNNFKNARSALRKDRQHKPEQREEWSSELLYEAMVKNSRHHSAGQGCFTIQELKILYPEELHVYDRWRSMKEKAEKSKGDENVAKANSEIDEDDAFAQDAIEEDEDKKLEEKTIEEFPISGHMAERCAQFDRRTDRMRRKSYLQFSVIRQGSFLGRITIRDVDEQDTGATGKWARMAPIYVRFLLWCGFDPQSSVPPPNETTAEALGFLAYNFLGRVVESAVRLRNEARKLNTGVVEVCKGDQLEVVDIENAMKDPRVNPGPIFDNSSHEGGNGVLGTQLYFGPGFENRLELEFEAMVNAAKQKKKKDEGAAQPKEASPDDLLTQFATPNVYDDE